MDIKFMKFYVTDGTKRVRVTYHLGVNQVTVYEKDYGRALGDLIPDAYKNDTDIMTDYFDYGRAVLSEGHPLYPAAKIAAEAFVASCQAKREAPHVTEKQVKLVAPDVWEIQSRGWHFRVQYRNKPGYKSWIVIATRGACLPKTKYFGKLATIGAHYSALRGIENLSFAGLAA